VAQPFVYFNEASGSRSPFTGILATCVSRFARADRSYTPLAKKHAPGTVTLTQVSRLVYVALALGTIALGLTVHLYGNALGPTSRDVLGDIIWGAMIAWWVGAIAPAKSLRLRSVAAVAICFAVELSQLVHAPPLDMLRRTTIGQLTLGTGFDLRDFLSYAVGVLAAAFLERTCRRRLGVSRSKIGDSL